MTEKKLSTLKLNFKSQIGRKEIKISFKIMVIKFKFHFNKILLKNLYLLTTVYKNHDDMTMR